MILSFAWTTSPLLAGVKTMTWREWTDRYAAMWRPGSTHDAYDRSPRIGGHKVGTIRLRSIMHGTTADMEPGDYEAEGLAWMYDHPEAWPAKIFGIPSSLAVFSRDAFEERRRDADPGYLLRFDFTPLPGMALAS